MDIVDMAFIKVDKEESFQLSNYTKRAKINDEQLQLLLMDRCLNITRINLTSWDGGIPTDKSSVKHGPENRVTDPQDLRLDITDEDLKSTFMAGVANIAAVSLAIGYPTAASAPHSSAFAVAAAPAAAAVDAAPAAAAKVERPEEESDDDSMTSSELDRLFGSELFG